MDYRALAAAAEQKYGLPPGLLYAQMMAESNGNPRAMSPKGAVGLMQFMPATARAMKINPLDPEQAIDGAGRMMQRLLGKFEGDIDRALASYNWGEGRVAKLGLDKMPAETVGYLQKVKTAMGGTAKDEANPYLGFVNSLGPANKAGTGKTVAQAPAPAGGDNPYMAFVKSLGTAAERGVQGAMTGPKAMQTGLEYELGSLRRGLQGGGLRDDPALRAEQQAAQERHDAAAADSPISTAIGRGTAYTPLALLGGAGPLVRLGSYAAPGLLQYGDVEQRLIRGAADAAMGAGFETVGKAIGGLARPGPARSNPIVRGGVEAADEINRMAKANAGPNAPQLTHGPYQLSGSGPKSAAAIMQDIVDSHPLSGPIGAARQNANSLAINHAAAFDLGVPLEAGKLTDTVFTAARSRGHALFDRAVPDAVQFDVTPVLNEAQAAINKVASMPQVRDEMTDFVATLKGHDALAGDRLIRGANGREMKDLHRWLTDYRASAWKKGMASAAEAADAVADALESALSRQLQNINKAKPGLTGPMHPTQVADNFAAARKHWAALSTLERPNIVRHGDVMPGNLHQAMAQRSPAAMAEGRWSGGLPEIARWYDKMGGSAPNSGTEARTFARRMVTDPVGAVTAGSGTGALISSAIGGDPMMGAAAGAASSFGLPLAVQLAMNSAPMRALYGRPGLGPWSEPIYQTVRSAGLLAGLGMAPNVPPK